MYEIKKHKDALRRCWKQARAEILPEHKRRFDSMINANIAALISFRYADTVLMYAPGAEEVDIMPLARAAIEQGKRVAFPRCNAESCVMTYRMVDSPDCLERGSYGIMEPPAGAPEYDGGGQSICLVPGLVYDREGYRLGYGKGYYDRFLSKFNGNAVGVVYSGFIIPEVPRGRYDMSVRVIVTERGVITAGK